MQPLSNVELALAALLVEAAIGYPAFIYRAIGHPVTWMGALLAGLETRLNRPAAPDSQRRALGGLTLAVLLAVTAGAALAVDRISSLGPIGVGLLILAATSLLAQRSLHDHVRAVADALENDGLEAGRAAVSMIVGRNPNRLDVAGVARAAIESLAENFSDGIVAPAFWLALAGLPGAACYKAANTADSMIGHRTPRYAAFGWAAARLDDVINLPASRLSALFLVLAAVGVGASPRGAMGAVWRDAKRHRSPNAGWPEAAMAGALGLQLAGPRVYGDTLVDDAFMGDGRREVTAADITRALRLYRTACVAQWLALLAIVVIWRG
jgi:adenosylcobinamide-phosphate synthase